MDEVVDPALTVKAIGHQWYWCYEYDDFVSLTRQKGIGIESYMVDVTDLKPGELRMLQVPPWCSLPMNCRLGMAWSWHSRCMQTRRLRAVAGRNLAILVSIMNDYHHQQHPF